MIQIPSNIGLYVKGWPTKGTFNSGGLPHVIRPDDITEGFAVIAQRGAGKSNYAGVGEEIMSARGDQWIAIDPAGAHIGIRNAASKDGMPQGPSGLQVLIVGGEQGDFPLPPGGGAEVAQILMETKLSCVIDLKHEKTADKKRFLTDFGNELLTKNKTPLHLFLDEADEIIPQLPENREEQEIRAVWRKVIKRGRSSGLGFTILSQRAAMVDKTSLYQIQNLIVMQLSGAGDLDTIKGWFKHNTYSSEHMDEILREMTSLNVGEAFLLSPRTFGGLFRIDVRKRVTFHAGRTPKAGEVAVEAKKYEIKEIADRFKSKLEEKKVAVADERNRVVTLGQELTRARATIQELQRAKPAPAKADEKAIERAVVTAVKKRDQEWNRSVRDFLPRLSRSINDVIVSGNANLAKAINECRFAPPEQSIEPQNIGGSFAALQNRELGTGFEVYKAGHEMAVTHPTNQLVDPTSDVKLNSTARKMLQVICQYPNGISRGKVAAQCGVKKSTGTFKTYLSYLRAGGLMTDNGDLLVPTQAGRDFLGGDVTLAPQTTEEVLNVWRPRFNGTTVKLLETLVSYRGVPVNKEKLAEGLGIKASTGTFKTYLSYLRTAGLITDPDSQHVAAHKENLFL